MKEKSSQDCHRIVDEEMVCQHSPTTPYFEACVRTCNHFDMVGIFGALEEEIGYPGLTILVKFVCLAL